MNTKNIDKTKVNETKLRIFEAFAGMGAQRKALENNKMNYEVAGMAEWFIPAIVSYQAIHNNLKITEKDRKNNLEDMVEYLESKTLSMDSKEPVRPGFWKRKKFEEILIIFKAVKMSAKEGNIFDVRTLYERKLSDVDLLTYSFPCQDLSQQGKQKGMSRNSGTRSGLLWEIEKALEETPREELPQFLLMENVVALTHKTNKVELESWIKKLESLGYKNDLGVLNAAEFGSSQARRRTFMISSLGEKIELPIGNKKPKSIDKVLEEAPRIIDFMPKLDNFKKTDFKKTQSNINKCKLINYSTFNSEAFVYDPKFTGPTLTASGANSRIKILYNDKIRKMNAKEAYQYMGFDKKDYNKVSKLGYLTETKMIYTCGNSISVEVLEAIMKRFG